MKENFNDIDEKYFSKNILSQNNSQSNLNYSAHTSVNSKETLEEGLKNFNFLEDSVSNDKYSEPKSLKNNESEGYMNSSISGIKSLPEQLSGNTQNENFLFIPSKNEVVSKIDDFYNLEVRSIKSDPSNYETNSQIISKEESPVLKNNLNLSMAKN